MATKDEYEVAQLYTDGRFHLARPLFAKRDPATGHFKKQAYGPWVLSVMRLLTGLKGLRHLARMCPAMIEALLPTLTASNHVTAVQLAGIAAEAVLMAYVASPPLKNL